MLVGIFWTSDEQLTRFRQHPTVSVRACRAQTTEFTDRTNLYFGEHGQPPPGHKYLEDLLMPKMTMQCSVCQRQERPSSLPYLVIPTASRVSGTPLFPLRNPLGDDNCLVINGSCPCLPGADYRVAKYKRIVATPWVLLVNAPQTVCLDAISLS
jgi:hypothetical protein